jgi:hypothetical protein
MRRENSGICRAQCPPSSATGSGGEIRPPTVLGTVGEATGVNRRVAGHKPGKGRQKIKTIFRWSLFFVFYTIKYEQYISILKLLVRVWVIG